MTAVYAKFYEESVEQTALTTAGILSLIKLIIFAHFHIKYNIIVIFFVVNLFKFFYIASVEHTYIQI